MATRAHIKYKNSPKALKKHIRPIIKTIMQDLVRDWHVDTLPEHFTERGRNRWNYRGRSSSYRKRKRKQLHHQDPLVWSGKLRRMAVRAGRVSGSSKSSRVSMTVPWYATKRFNGKQTYAEEMTAITLKESREMAKLLQQRLVSDLNSLNEKSTTRL